MNIQHLTAVLFGLTLSYGLIVPAVAQPNNFSKQNLKVQHLTCVQDTKGLICNVDEALKVSNVSKKEAPEPVTTKQLRQLSNILLGITFFGMPTALLLAISLHDKQDAQRTQLIEQLERIWELS